MFRDIVSFMQMARFFGVAPFAFLAVLRTKNSEKQRAVSLLLQKRNRLQSKDFCGKRDVVR
jgi:hypothetical protein